MNSEPTEPKTAQQEINDEYAAEIKRVRTQLNGDPRWPNGEREKFLANNGLHPDSGHNPVPPDGCVCASFWTIRGKHKADCPLADSGQANEGAEAVRAAINKNYALDFGGCAVEVDEATKTIKVNPQVMLVSARADGAREELGLLHEQITTAGHFSGAQLYDYVQARLAQLQSGEVSDEPAGAAVPVRNDP